MKKKMAIVVASGLMITLVGCGGNQNTMTEEAQVTEIVESVETTEVTETIEPTVKAEEEDRYAVSEEDYVDAGKFIGVTSRGDTNPETLIDTDSFEKYSEFYYLPESVNLYFSDGYLGGYTKPNIEVQTQSKSNDWYFIYVGDYSRLVKAEDFEKVAFKGTKEDYENRNKTTNTTEETTSTSKQETSVETETETNPVAVTPEPVEETPVQSEPVEEQVVLSDKYTPEEAIAIYRSIMEANGISWDPSIKEFASWGTGWLYLDKGYAEEAANSSVQSFQMGDTGGNSWTKYYLEVTGSDEDCVYVTAWHCN